MNLNPMMINKKVKLHDTVYFGSILSSGDHGNAMLEQSFVEELKGKFPEVRVENAHGRTMGYRQLVEIDDIDPYEYYTWMMARGWAKKSLNMLAIASVKSDFMDRVTYKAKAKYPHLFV